MRLLPPAGPLCRVNCNANVRREKNFRMRNLILLASLAWAVDRKEINEWKLDEEYRKGDDIEPDDLPEFERPAKPIDLKNVSYYFLLQNGNIETINIDMRLTLIFHIFFTQ